MRTRILTVVAVAAIVVLPGCALKDLKDSPSDLETQLQQKEQEVAQLQASVEDMERDLNTKDSEIRRTSDELGRAERSAEQARAEARAAAKAAESKAPPPSSAGPQMLPPDAKSGECFARVFVPPAYKTETETVLRHEASDRIEILPAKYEWVEERVQVRESSQRLEVVPAKYELVEDKVLVRPATKRLEQVPAKYKDVSEQVLVKPAETVWKKGRGPIEKIDNATGEIMCRVETPAVYKTVNKRVLVSAAATRTVEIPAEYKTVKRTVVAKPATTRTVEIPAEYKTVKVQKLVTPSTEKRVPIPAEYQTVTREVMTGEGGIDWRPVLCETNMTGTTIRDIQRALQSAGHSPGPIDGVYGRQTSAAVRSFQQSKGLPTGGLTLRTIDALGVKI